MRYGQMSYPKVSQCANYVQLDICGLNADEAVAKYQKYKPLPVILHGDWTKKGASENNLLERLEAYIAIIEALKAETIVLGFTLHPPTRKKLSKEVLLDVLAQMNQHAPTFLENRSSSKLHCSLPEEVIAYSREVDMTIDLPQLYIACGYDVEALKITLDQIDFSHIKEIHLANIKRDGTRSYVGRKLTDGCLPIAELMPYIERAEYVTFEILGGIPTFDAQVEFLKNPMAS